ncbi:MAG: Cna B-type domain-containing protein, partial [Coriobacteriales bacterium]
MHDGDTLDSIVDVPEGTYLVVKSDQDDHDANVEVTENGGFVVENGAVLVLENVNLSGDENERSMPVFSVYGDMVMNDGAVKNFSSTSTGSSSNYGKGGVPAICVVDGTFTMNDGTISGNSNTTTKEVAFGGALRAEGEDATVIINDGKISGNTVLSSAIVPDDLTVTANALGGAIAITEGASISISGGYISDNTAGSHEANASDADYWVCSGNGGAIAVYSSSSDTISSLYLEGGTIANNNAFRTDGDAEVATLSKNKTHGGGIFSNSYTRAVFNSGMISGNTSDDKGGGLFLDCEKEYGGATFKNTLVSGNEAEILGGGIWFCPTGESYMFSESKADGIALFDNTTTVRDSYGAGDDLYVSPRIGDTGVVLTDTMPGGGSNAWYQDGGAGTMRTSNLSSRYSSSDAEETSTVLQASAAINRPSEEARDGAIDSATVLVTDNHSTYGGGIGSNHCLIFGTPTSEEEEEFNVPGESNVPGDSTIPGSNDNFDSGTISINVDKVWVGDAADSATVHLLADGTEVASAELTADNNWSYTFTGLSKADSDGDIEYTLTEDSLDGYDTDITGSADEGFTVTNTKLIDIDVTKVWVGDAADSATVRLLADGEEVANYTLTADDDWTHTFTDLPQADSDGDIEYTLTEDSLDGYDTEITGSADDGFTVTNTKLIDIAVDKVWVGDASDSATVRLLANNEEVANYTLTADDEWTHTFTDLPQADSDGDIDYTLTEDQVEGYSSTVTENTDGSFTVKNISEAEVGVRVVKDWRGMPEAVTVNLYGQSGDEDAALVESVTLDGVADTLSSDSDTGIEYGEDDAWVAVFTGLPKYDSQTGAEITYSVTEDKVSETSSVISDPTTEGDVITYTITNTRSATFQPTVTKVWGEGVTSQEVTIQLKQGDNVVEEITLDGTIDDGVSATGTESGEYAAWQGRFSAVDKFDDRGAPIDYTVSEVTTGDWQSSVSGNARTGFTIQNSPLGATSATLAASKTVNGGEVGGNAFSFELYEGDSATGTLLQTVQNDHDGAVTFSPIVYTTSGTRTYTIVEKDEGATDVTYDSSVYTVTVAVSDADGDGNLDTPTITYSKDGQTVSAASFDNTVITRTSVSFTKDWNGDAGESATVRLMCSTDGGEAV